MAEKYNDLRKALEFTLKWEGGYSNDPTDPGGETKWGISKRAHPNVDIKNLTPDQALDIYDKEYWQPSGCDGIPFPCNVAVFDTAVNCGVHRAAQWLKNAVNTTDYLKLRKEYYYGLVNRNPLMMKYIKGWMNRLNDLQKFVEINHTGG